MGEHNLIGRDLARSVFSGKQPALVLSLKKPVPREVWCVWGPQPSTKNLVTNFSGCSQDTG